MNFLSLTQAIALAIGALSGAFGRYFFTFLNENGTVETAKFPLGTFLTNIIGCLLIGLFFGLKEKFNWGNTMQIFFVTGLLGSFTTFSSFAVEILFMLKNNGLTNALIYFGLSNIVGITLAIIGYKLISS
jgi:CrcB protein